MSCCIDFASSKQIIEDICQQYHPDDYKIFVAHRVAEVGLLYKVQVGVVVKPDVSVNTEMFEAFLKLHARSDVCIKVLQSDINFQETKLVDIFLLEIESEV